MLKKKSFIETNEENAWKLKVSAPALFILLLDYGGNRSLYKNVTYRKNTEDFIPSVVTLGVIGCVYLYI